MEVSTSPPEPWLVSYCAPINCHLLDYQLSLGCWQMKNFRLMFCTHFMCKLQFPEYLQLIGFCVTSTSIQVQYLHSCLCSQPHLLILLCTVRVPTFLSCEIAWFFPRHFSKKTHLFLLNVASTYHWGSVYRNTNLLQIHFPKVKPPYIATPKAMYISTTFFIYLPTVGKIPWFENFFPDFGWKKNTCFYWKKFSKYLLISLFSGNPDSAATGSSWSQKFHFELRPWISLHYLLIQQTFIKKMLYLYQFSTFVFINLIKGSKNKHRI